MKGILLSAIALLCYAILSIPFLRRYRGRKPYRVLQISFLLSVGVYVLLFSKISAAGLGFSEAWLEPHAAVDFWNGLLLMLLLYQPYLALYYGTTFNGISAQMMVFLHQHGPMNCKELLGRFIPDQADRWEDPTTSWRLVNLTKGGFIEPTADGHRLLPKGRCAAILCRFLKRLVVGREAGGGS